ncbi:MAG TPA: YhgE/Pip domain-containing protein [Streptosporangiaceae bacterium]|nr:YhgE/Pip domain-containing protein [Streptosporangiaceae bacterium]
MSTLFALLRREAAAVHASRLARAGLGVVLLLPLLYGSLYLWAFWNPTAHLDRVPVALVDADRPVTVHGHEVDAGAQLTRTLLHLHAFDWHVVSAGQAASGVADGDYYLAVTVPPGFSADVASPERAGHAPEQARVDVVLNDANSYLASTLARDVLAQVRSVTSAHVATTDAGGLLTGLAQAHGGFQRASTGAARLARGADAVNGGAARLAPGTESLANGAASLAHGATAANAGARSLASGTQSIAAGAKRLAVGASQLSADTAGLPARTARLSAGAQQVSAGTTRLASGLDSFAAQTGELTAAQARALAALRAAAAAYPQDAALQQAVTAVTATGDASASALTAVASQTGPVQALAAGAGQVAAGAQRLAGAAPELAGGTAALSASTERLAAGTGQVSAGASRLAVATTSMSAGTNQLSGGAAGLAEGAQGLASGSGRLATAATTLHRRLAGGARTIPVLHTPAQQRLARVVGNPVGLATQRHDPAGSYGAGFAPYFIGIALWVGAIFMFGVMRPVARRVPGEANHPLRRTLAGYLVVLTVGAIQAVILAGALHYGLGLDPARPLGTLAFLVLAAASFGAVLQLLHARLGPAGRVLGVVLLVLQITSSGGTYPIETTPAFFRALHPFTPMTYVVTGLRRLLAGGELGPVWAAVGVLGGLAVVSLALTWWTARRGRDVSAAVVGGATVTSQPAVTVR